MPAYFRSVIPRSGNEVDVMNSDRSTATGRSSDGRAATGRPRRFLALGANIGAIPLAGCSGSGLGASGGDATASDVSSGTSDAGTATTVGGFRLPISDQPVAVVDRIRLVVDVNHGRFAL